MKPPVRIHLRLLGRFALSLAGDQADSIRLSTRKAGALLAYLAMSPEQTASREELATLLWGGCSDQQARQSLRQALALLRKEIGQSHFFTANNEVVRLQGGLWSVDACEFEDLARSSRAEDLERAGRLFAGDFLSGLNIEEEGFEEWVRGQRQRMQMAASRLCETYATCPERVANGQQAVAAAERLLALDPLREDWQRSALTLYARYRGKAEALAQAEAFAGLLQRELGVALEEETRALIGKIQSGEIERAVGPVSPSPAAIGAASHALSDATLLIAPPNPQDQEADHIAAPVAAQPLRGLGQWRGWATAAVLTVAAVVLAGGLFGLGRGRTVPELPTQPNGQTQTAAPGVDPWQSPSGRETHLPKGIIPIAVLPFAALGDTGASTQLIADMMSDDLINILSRVPAFRVISRQTTSRYRGQPIDVAAIGAELQVRYVLEGSVRMQDDTLRVNLQLLDPATRLPVWSGRVERTGADRYAVRDEIVARIARELQIDILPIEGERRSADQTADGSAYLGWAAMYAAYSRTGIDEYRKAEAHFKQALERDPQHIAALIGMGAYHANLAVQRLVPDTKAHFDKAHDILSQAVQRAPRDASALLNLGILLQGSGKIRDGLALFEKAVELSPSNAASYAHIGHALARLGQAEKGIEHIRYAMRLSPKEPALPIWHEFLGNAQLELNLHREAIGSFRQSATLAPRYPRAWAGLVAAHALAGDVDGVKTSLDRLKALAVNIDEKNLIERFGRRKDSRLYEGLRLALTPSVDPWQSPPLPDKRADDTGRPNGPITAIAILPFTTYGETEGSIQTIADIITDDLTNNLSRVSMLRVISRQTMRSYLGEKIDISTVGSQLGVRYVLEGNMRMLGDRLRVNVELIDPAMRLPAWSARIERDRADQHAVQDEIVGRLARELHFQVYHAVSERASKDPGVTELIYTGWAAILDHGTEGIGALKRAEAAFMQALERDPGNRSGKSGLGAYHTLVGSLQLVPDWRAHLVTAEELVRQSIREVPEGAAQHFYLSIIQRMRGELKDALESLGRCLEITPSMAPCHAHLGHTLAQMNRAGEGIEHINYALRLSPRDMSRPHWLRFAAETEIELRQFARATALLHQSYAANPSQPRTLRSLAAVYALSGNLDEAHKYLAELKASAPHVSPEGYLRRPPQLDGTQPELLRGLRLALGAPADLRSPRSAATETKPLIPIH